MTAPSTFLDEGTQPGMGLLAHLRRRRFVYLSGLLHAALLGVLVELGPHRIELERQRSERRREQQAIDYGKQLTERARLEQRVHDMARIESLLEQSEAAGDAPKAQPAPRDDDDVQFSAKPRTADALLRQARELSRKIDALQRDIKATELARLLRIPKQKALEKLPAPPQPQPQTAATIEQLEARARDALEQRRRQLERQQDGMPVAASGAGAGANQAGPGGQTSGQGKGPSAGLGADQGRGNTGGVSRSVLSRIDAFTNRDMPEHATRAYTAGGMADFFDHGIGTMPAVDAARTVKGEGRLIGPGGPYANRIYVNAWYLIGPFDGKHGEGLFSNERHPPEQGVVLDAAYRGKDGRLLRWNYVDTAPYPLIPSPSAEDAVYYGYTELMMDEERDLTAWVGADDDAQLWLNDRLVWKGGNVNKDWFFSQIYDTSNTGVRDYNLSEGTRTVHLRKGRNKLFFKLSNGPTRLFFSLVLTK
jgi:hypothetical protein